MNARVLIAEDDPRARASLEALLTDEGYEAAVAEDGLAAARLLADDEYDAALFDVRMPGKDGLTLLREVNKRPRPPAVLVMTAYGNSSIAIEAMKLGAYDYLVKPLRFDELLIQLERAVETRRQALDLDIAPPDPSEAEPELIGQSAAMQQVYKLIGQAAPTDSTVLIRGESGSGKELIARAIHHHSRRADWRLVTVNCAAIPETLLEAELFGHEKGAFTGAVSRKRGRFELAHGGTIFLDEVGELSPATQAKLLRVLQERTIERLGSEQTVELDVRIVAATNRDLEEAVAAGEFRDDLYYRLRVVEILAPPLRQRREDIPVLAERLVRKIAAQRRLPAAPLTEEALSAMKQRDWPGNVRELEHALERALILSRGAPLRPEHFESGPAAPSDPFDALPLEDGLHVWTSRLERRLVERALETAQGNRTRAAALLGIHRRVLYDKLREFGLQGEE